MPTLRARDIIESSFSGTDGKLVDGSLTIQEPSIPSAGIVRPPVASVIAENFSWTPASENLNGLPD